MIVYDHFWSFWPFQPLFDHFFFSFYSLDLFLPLRWFISRPTSLLPTRKQVFWSFLIAFHCFLTVMIILTVVCSGLIIFHWFRQLLIIFLLYLIVFFIFFSFSIVFDCFWSYCNRFWLLLIVFGRLWSFLIICIVFVRIWICFDRFLVVNECLNFHSFGLFFNCFWSFLRINRNRVKIIKNDWNPQEQSKSNPNFQELKIRN